MRLFIAFEVPEEVKTELKEIQKRIAVNEKSKINFTKDFHLTLKFLGEVDDNKVNLIKQQLKKIKLMPFEAKLSNLGIFPSKSYIRVVWVGLEPRDKILELQQKIDQAVIDLKQIDKYFRFKKEKSFHPHLTLARVKYVDDISRKQLIEKIENPDNQPRPLTFPVKSFKLIKSTLTNEGAVYEDVAELH